MCKSISLLKWTDTLFVLLNGVSTSVCISAINQSRNRYSGHEMNTLAVCQHAFSYDDARRSTNVLLCSSWAQKYWVPVFKWLLNTYTFIAPKRRFLQRKIAKLHHNVLSKVRFMENIEIQTEPRFRGHSMNTLNIYRRRPRTFLCLTPSSWMRCDICVTFVCVRNEINQLNWAIVNFCYFFLSSFCNVSDTSE